MSRHIHIHVHNRVRTVDDEYKRDADGKFGSGGGGSSHPSSGEAAEASKKASDVAGHRLAESAHTRAAFHAKQAGNGEAEKHHKAQAAKHFAEHSRLSKTESASQNNPANKFRLAGKQPG